MAEPAIKFDTAAAVEQLIEAGIPREHAAAQVRLLADTINDNFATKADIERLELKLDTRTAELRSEIADVRTEVANLETGLTGKIAELRTEIADVRTEVANLGTRLTGKIAELDTKLTGKIAELDVRLQNTLKWTAGMQVGTILAIIAAVKLI